MEVLCRTDLDLSGVWVSEHPRLSGRVYGSTEVLLAIAEALEFAADHVPYINNLLLAKCQCRQLPTYSESFVRC